MGKRQLLVIGLLLAILGIGVVLLVPSKPRVWSLPDGSTLRLVKITWGTNHVCRYGNKLIDYLYPFVPARYRTNFHFQVAETRIAPPGGVVVCLEHTSVSTNAAHRSLSGLRSISVSVADDSGIESSQNIEIPFAMPAVWGIRSSREIAFAAFWNSQAGTKELIGLKFGPDLRRAQTIRILGLPGRSNSVVIGRIPPTVR